MFSGSIWLSVVLIVLFSLEGGEGDAATTTNSLIRDARVPVGLPTHVFFLLTLPIAAPAAGGVHTATRATHQPPPALTPALPNFAGPSPRHLPRPPDVPHRPTGGTTAATPRRPQTVTAAGPATAPGRRAINLWPEEN